MNLGIDYLRIFTDAYIDCCAWVNEDNEGFELGANYFDKIERDCAKFIDCAKGYLKDLSASESGHDFYLTRNGHGSGFWDRGYEKTISDALCAISKAFGESYEGI